MEDTLRVRMLTVCKSMLDVLILVLMEDTLRENSNKREPLALFLS